MVLQQNNMLKQEVDQLRGQVKATHESRALDEVVKGSEKVQLGRALELTNQPQEPQVLSLEDRKSEATEPAQGNEWTTPPESVSAKKPVEAVVETWNSNGPPVQVTAVSGSTGMDVTKDQTQVLGQVTQTLSNLVAQLAAVSGPTGGVQERRDDVCQAVTHHLVVEPGDILLEEEQGMVHLEDIKDIQDTVKALEDLAVVPMDLEVSTKRFDQLSYQLCQGFEKVSWVDQLLGIG
eukprot:s179_g28.t1